MAQNIAINNPVSKISLNSNIFHVIIVYEYFFLACLGVNEARASSYICERQRVSQIFHATDSSSITVYLLPLPLTSSFANENLLHNWKWKYALHIRFCHWQNVCALFTKRQQQQAHAATQMFTLIKSFAFVQCLSQILLPFLTHERTLQKKTRKKASKEVTIKCVTIFEHVLFIMCLIFGWNAKWQSQTTHSVCVCVFAFVLLSRRFAFDFKLMFQSLKFRHNCDRCRFLCKWNLSISTCYKRIRRARRGKCRFKKSAGLLQQWTII